MKTRCPLVMIFDDKFFTPACVTITSLLLNKNQDSEYIFYVCTPNLSEENEKILKRFMECYEGVRLNIIRTSVKKYESIYTQYDGNTGAGSITAMIKFDIPTLIEENIILYLDSDLIIRSDLSPIFNYDINEKYAAVVRDSGIIYNKSGLRGQLPLYFNSGVMLLNLQRMRDTNATDLLINTKKTLNNNLVDQDAFNYVFNNNVVELPIKYNCLIVNLFNSCNKFDIRELNEIYGTCYSCIYDLYDSACIIHYASKEKPWKYRDAPFSKEWEKYYLASPSRELVRQETLKDHVSQKNIPFILATDNNYTPQTGITILSALENRLSEVFYSFYILTASDFDSDTDERFQQIAKKYGNCSIEYIKMNEDLFKDVKLSIPHITHPTFYRLIAASFFPKYDKLIYLDSDVIVEGDLLDYYNLDLQKYYIAGVKAPSYHWAPNGNKEYCDRNGLPGIDQYVNAGVLIFNLKKIREDKIEEEFIRLSKLGLRSQDQDVINRACYNHILHIPYKYNCMIAKYEKNPEQPEKIFSMNEILEANNCPVITHYAAEVKPWADLSCPLSDRWWKYARMSPYFDIMIQRYGDKLIDNGKKIRLNGQNTQCAKNQKIIFVGEYPKNKTIKDCLSDIKKILISKLKRANKMANVSELIRKFDDNYKVADENQLKELYQLLQKATSTHNGEIYGRLGRMYRDGAGVSKNLSESVRLFELASNLNVKWAKKELVDTLILAGKYYDLEKAFQLSLEMAESGDTFGACRVARLYSAGLGVEKNIELAIYWYAKAITSNPGWVGEYVDVLLSTKNSDYVSQAVELCKKYSEEGNANLQGRLARIYYNGSGVEKNKDLAAYWMLKASENNSGWAIECVDLLISLNDKQYYQDAYKICKKYAESGNAGMQGRLARMYRDGVIIPQDMTLAKEWYKKAMDNGNKWASEEYNLL